MTSTLPIIANTTTPSGASKRGGSQLGDALMCQRKWFLRYHQRIVPIAEPEYRLGGTLIHDAVAHLYGARLAAEGRPPTWWAGDDVDTLLARRGAGVPHLVQRAREVYDAYRQRWWGNEPWEPVAVEEEFRTTVGDLDPGGSDYTLDDEVVTCGTDLIVRNTDTGDLWVVDHKTKAHGRDRVRLPPWPTNGGEFALHLQAHLNLHIVRRAYPNEVVRGFIINRITRGAPYDFDRYALHNSPRVYDSVPRAVRHAVAEERRIVGMIAAGTPPVPAYWRCQGRYGACDYLRLCNADSVSDMRALRSMHYTQLEA